MSGTTRGGAGSRSVKRFPLYLRVLREMELNGEIYASGAVVAKALSFDPIVVRKDFAKTGICGKPRLGFPLNELICSIKKFMGWQKRMDAVLVGAGRLGSALIGYPGFKEQGFQIVAAFDVKPARNQTISDVPVYPVTQLSERVKELKVSLGILTVPDAFAQDVADAMIAGGVRGIWNFTPVRLKVPADVIVKREDLAASLALLSYRLHQDEDVVK